MATRTHAVLCRGAAVVILAGIVADAFGLLLGHALLWAAGARLMTAGIVLAVLATLAGAFTRRAPTRRRTALRIAGMTGAILLLALARWVRGHPQVKPDPPIFAAEVVAGMAMLALLRNGNRARDDTPKFTAEPRSPAE